jgi:hypothetical protein
VGAHLTSEVRIGWMPDQRTTLRGQWARLITFCSTLPIRRQVGFTAVVDDRQIGPLAR